MKRKVMALLLGLSMVLSCACSAKTESTESLAAQVADLEKANSKAVSEKAYLEEYVGELESQLDDAWADSDKAESEKNAVSSQFESYKEGMAEFEKLSEDEKKAREIEASKAIAKDEEEKRQKEEKAAEEQRKAEEKAAKESEEKQRKAMIQESSMISWQEPRMIIKVKK